MRASARTIRASPEPLAVEHTYRFIRALYQRTLRRALMKERFKLRLVEKVVLAVAGFGG